MQILPDCRILIPTADENIQPVYPGPARRISLSAQKGKAWDFKPYDRDVHVTSDAKVAWFSELLTTWMGVCRGSGILIRTDQGWKLEQYHLSVTVPNDIIKDFISLVESKSKC